MVQTRIECVHQNTYLALPPYINIIRQGLRSTKPIDLKFTRSGQNRHKSDISLNFSISSRSNSFKFHIKVRYSDLYIFSKFQINRFGRTQTLPNNVIKGREGEVRVLMNTLNSSFTYFAPQSLCIHRTPDNPVQLAPF